MDAKIEEGEREEKKYFHGSFLDQVERTLLTTFI